MGIADEDKPQAEPDILPSNEGKLSIDLSEDDEEPEAALGAPTNTPEDRKSRRAQFREMKESKRRTEERYTALEREVAELRGRLSAPQAPAPVYRQEPAADPIEAEIDSLWQQQQILLRSMQSTQTPESQVEKDSNTWRQLERKRRALEIKQVVGETPRQDTGVTEERIANQLLTSEFPEIFNNEAMRLRAMAEMQDLMGRVGKPKSIATAREACERVMDRHGLRKSKAPPPTAAEQARYTSVPSRAGAAGGGTGNYTPSKNVLANARGYTSHLKDLTDEERVRKWIKEIAKPNGIPL
jgi:hypothetical protein